VELDSFPPIQALVIRVFVAVNLSMDGKPFGCNFCRLAAISTLFSELNWLDGLGGGYYLAQIESNDKYSGYVKYYLDKSLKNPKVK